MANLRVYILKSLMQQPVTGYDIMKVVQSETGYRPSAGIVYPIFKDLHDEGMVTVTRKGKRRVHEITEKGRRHFQEMMKRKQELFSSLINNTRIIGEACGDKESIEYLVEYFKRLQEGHAPLGDIGPQTFALKKAVLRLVMRDDFKSTAPRVKEILVDATKELSKL